MYPFSTTFWFLKNVGQHIHRFLVQPKTPEGASSMMQKSRQMHRPAFKGAK